MSFSFAIFLICSKDCFSSCLIRSLVNPNKIPILDKDNDSLSFNPNL